MYLVKKQLKTFSAAHRLIKGYVGKCRNLHGHNYAVRITFTAAKLDEYDFVIDFDDINKLCNRWVVDNWDHGVLVNEADSALLNFCRQEQQKYYILPDNQNSTVECLSKHLFHQFQTILQTNEITACYPHLSIIQVEVAETETAKAIYREERVL